MNLHSCYENILSARMKDDLSNISQSTSFSTPVKSKESIDSSSIYTPSEVVYPSPKNVSSLPNSPSPTLDKVHSLLQTVRSLRGELSSLSPKKR